MFFPDLVQPAASPGSLIRCRASAGHRTGTAKHGSYPIKAAGRRAGWPEVVQPAASPEELDPAEANSEANSELASELASDLMPEKCWVRCRVSARHHE